MCLFWQSPRQDYCTCTAKLQLGCLWMCFCLDEMGFGCASLATCLMKACCVMTHWPKGGPQLSQYSVCYMYKGSCDNASLPAHLLHGAWPCYMFAGAGALTNTHRGPAPEPHSAAPCCPSTWHWPAPNFWTVCFTTAVFTPSTL